MGEVKFKTPDGLSMATLRKVFYVAIAVWLVGVRMMNVNPFDDFFAPNVVTFSTLFDFIALFALWIIFWVFVWPLRPRT